MGKYFQRYSDIRELHMGIRSKVMTVTPSIAKDWIKKTGTSNFRTTSMLHVERLARQMASGDWHLNGESIKIDESGKVVDGLHRLHAVVSSGSKIESVIVFNVNDSFSIDEPRTRTQAQWFAHFGYKDVAALCSALNIIKCFERKVFNLTISSRPTSQELLEYAKEHSGIIKYVTKAGMAKGVIAPSLLAAVTYLGTKPELREGDTIGSECALEFIQGIAKGEMLESTDPRLLLRNRLLKAKQDHHSKLGKMTTKALTIIAWNKFVLGDPCSSLKYTVGGARKQSFPEIMIADY